MQNQFNGLTMPVFTAFGWAGEEQAQKYALAQLEAFITHLHASLPRRVQNVLPFYGLSAEMQGVYLAANQDPEKDLHIAFYARPMSLEIQLAITDKMAVGRALKPAAANPEQWRDMLQALGAAWTLHIKQMELDEETGERTSYQELYKDSVEKLDEETAESVSSRANFLNSEPQWVTPFFLSRRIPSEQVASMGQQVVGVMVDEIRELVPLLELMTGKAEKAAQKPAAKAKAKPKKEPTPVTEIDPENQFVYVTELKPLHIRRGFVNLTPEHWDFFAQSARATTREVTVLYGEDKKDDKSSVWRLASNDMARIVLSDRVRSWFRDSFDAGDRVQVTATKRKDEKIELLLELVA